MTQKHRPSLSQTRALYEPLGIEDEIAQARASLARDVERARQEAQSRETFKTLAAPVSARKRHAKLTAAGQFDFSYASPTKERAEKSTEGWDKTYHAGGRIGYQAKSFMQVHDMHITDAGKQAAELLIAGWETRERVLRMTSDRAYTGMPFTGQGGAGDPTPKQLDDAGLFERAYNRLNKHTGKWWRILQHMVLNEPDPGRDRPLTPQELGSQFSAYRARETTTAVAVGLVHLALLKWLEAVYEELPGNQSRSQEGVDRGRRSDIESEALYRKRLTRRR